MYKYWEWDQTRIWKFLIRTRNWHDGKALQIWWIFWYWGRVLDPKQKRMESTDVAILEQLVKCLNIGCEHLTPNNVVYILTNHGKGSLQHMLMHSGQHITIHCKLQSAHIVSCLEEMWYYRSVMERISTQPHNKTNKKMRRITLMINWIWLNHEIQVWRTYNPRDGKNNTEVGMTKNGTLWGLCQS